MSEANSSTRKVFVGIKVPESIANLLQAFNKTDWADGGDVRWSDPDDLHITLEFIGVVPSSAIPRLIEKLNDVRYRKFDAEISDAVVFEDAGVLAADIHKSIDLASLQNAIASALSDGETVPEKRAYRPHISLICWVPKNPLPQLKLLQSQVNQHCKELPIKSFRVEKYILYETLSGHYRVLAEFVLED